MHETWRLSHAHLNHAYLFLCRVEFDPRGVRCSFDATGIGFISHVIYYVCVVLFSRGIVGEEAPNVSE